MTEGQIPKLPSSSVFDYDHATYENLIEDLLLGRRFAEEDRLSRASEFLEALVDKRGRAAAFFENVLEDPTSWDLGPKRITRLRALVERFRCIASYAEDLRDRICDREPEESDEADVIATRLENGRSLVILVPVASEATLEALRGEGYEVAPTPWGTGVSLDEPRRRGMAARLAATIRDLDAEAYRLLS